MNFQFFSYYGCSIRINGIHYKNSFVLSTSNTTCSNGYEFWFLLSMDMINTHIIMSLCLGVLLLKDLPCSYVPIVSYLCTIFVSMLRWFPFDVRQVLTYFSDIMPDKILSELPLIETSNMQ